MPSWRKSPQSLIDTFAAVLPADSRVERRSMFGYPSAFVGGNMACGLHQDDVVLRLGEGGEKDLGGAPFEPMAGRPMRGYFTVPPAMRDDRAALAQWVKRAIDFAATLPQKTKAAPRAKVAPKPKPRREPAAIAKAPATSKAPATKKKSKP